MMEGGTERRTWHGEEQDRQSPWGEGRGRLSRGKGQDRGQDRRDRGRKAEHWVDDRGGAGGTAEGRTGRGQVLGHDKGKGKAG